MFYFLLERLRKIDEVVATADPQKVMKDFYRTMPKKLTLSTWPSPKEGNEYKFWLLQDGTVIPVEYAHQKTVFRTGLELGRDFMETGAVAGYFNLVNDEIGVDSGKRPTKKQISVLKNLYLDYKVSTLYSDIPGRKFTASIKSVDHLDYLLTYGKDVDEAKSEEEQKEQFFLDRTNKHIQLVLEE